jgi:microcystin-dependent protein
MYALVGLAVIVVLIVVFLVMKKKEPYTPGSQGGGDNRYFLTSDANGNLGTTYGVPYGSIMLWNGSPETVPKGWAICDGQNGTPDLRDRFVIGGGGPNYNDNNGVVGGSNTATLTPYNMPSHTHNLSISQFSGAATGWPTYRNPPNSGGIGPLMYMPAYGTNAGQDYSLSGWGNQKEDGTYLVSSVGNGEAFSILPPYYVLFYIMKLKDSDVN